VDPVLDPNGGGEGIRRPCVDEERPRGCQLRAPRAGPSGSNERSSLSWDVPWRPLLFSAVRALCQSSELDSDRSCERSNSCFLRAAPILDRRRHSSAVEHLFRKQWSSKAYSGARRGRILCPFDWDPNLYRIRALNSCRAQSPRPCAPNHVSGACHSVAAVLRGLCNRYDSADSRRGARACHPSSGRAPCGNRHHCAKQ